MPRPQLDLSSADLAAIMVALLTLAERPPPGISKTHLLALIDRIEAFDAAQFPDDHGEGRPTRPF